MCPSRTAPSALYRLRGSLDRVASLILTEDDSRAVPRRSGQHLGRIAGLPRRKTILFVGYDLDDQHFKRLYRKVTAAAG